jgi:hypothetical protein
MRSNTKKNQIYEINLRKMPVNNNSALILPRISRPNIQKLVSVSNALADVKESVIEPVIEPVIECVENEVNNLQYVKNKIMSKYDNLYKTKTV